MEPLTLILLFTQVTAEFDLPPGLLASVCYTESRYNVRALNRYDGGSPSYGLCQIKYATAKEMGFEGSTLKLMEPSINAYYAGKYLQKQISRYNGNITKGVIAYNIGNAKNRIETQYSRKVLAHWRANYYVKAD